MLGLIWVFNSLTLTLCFRHLLLFSPSSSTLCKKCDRQRRERSQRNNSGIEGEQKHNLEINGTVTALADQTYPQLIFQLIDNAKPQPDHPKHSKKSGETWASYNLCFFLHGRIQKCTLGIVLQCNQSWFSFFNESICLRRTNSCFFPCVYILDDPNNSGSSSASFLKTQW